MTPLWLLHGFLGAPASWAGVLEHLARPARATWLFGHGAPPREVPRDFWAAVDALAAEMSEPALVVGYSMGGRLALGLACRYPERVRGVVAIGARLGLDEAARCARIGWEESLARKLEREGLPSFVEAWEKLPLFASQAALPAAKLAAQRAVRLGHDASALARCLRALGTGRMPRLALAPHAIVVRGELDPGAEEAPLPDRTLAGVGHNPLIEAPETLARLLDTELRTLENPT